MVYGSNDYIKQIESQIGCRGTLHLWCQLYDKDIFGCEILDFRIFYLGTGCGDQAFSQTLKTGRPKFTFSRKRMRD